VTQSVAPVGPLTYAPDFACAGESSAHIAAGLATIRCLDADNRNPASGDGWLPAILSDNSSLDYAQKVYRLAQVRSQRPENRRRREWCGWWRWTLGSRRACPR
jgi:hypothetical protein